MLMTHLDVSLTESPAASPPTDPRPTSMAIDFPHAMPMAPLSRPEAGIKVVPAIVRREMHPAEPVRTVALLDWRRWTSGIATRANGLTRALTRGVSRSWSGADASQPRS